MDEKQGAPDLYEFLVEAELQQYYSTIKNELKIAAIHQLKYATDQDFKSIGLSRPELRRLYKFRDKYNSQGYLSKIKRLLQAPKRDEMMSQSPAVEVMSKAPTSPTKVPNNKHIIPLDAICVNKQLGVGEFGIVQQGVWTNGNERIQVAIKCLCRERMQSNPMEFLKEAAIMHSIDHENIVRLYGVVLSTDSLMLVTELAHLRSLLECLKDSDLRVKFLTVPVLCDFALQICNGMMYLESNRLIHRDLAARNILVFSKNKVKISDFGLSRALGVGKDYYKTNFNVNLKLPIAWCAPECVNYLKFTSSSDVWAFAVCLWEMFSYGFQPWPAFTGHQILEAIDKPNFQRLEQPECCPKEYYTLMLKCWNHEPSKRPKFSEIHGLLPDMKPEQLKTITQCPEVKIDHLAYHQGEIVTVLDKAANSPYWLGVLNSGKTGFFNPNNTVAHLESLPSSTSNHHPSSGAGGFIRNTLERSSKRKLNTDMISSPQNDLKHTGHVGIDGNYFGNVAFLSNSQTYNKLPRQVVTPYKPSEDLEQTPLLLPPTPTSPDSTQMGSAYFSESSNLIANAQLDRSHNNESLSSDFQRLGSMTNGTSHRNSMHNPIGNGSFKDSNPFASADHVWSGDISKNFVNLPTDKKLWDNQDPHDYHEISDDEMMPSDKVFDFGPSLLDEMDFMFRSMTTSGDSSSLNPPLTPNFDNVNKRNELTEINSKLSRKVSGGNASGMTAVSTYKSKKKPSTVKPISVKDEKILNQAIEIANEMSARSMTDLDQNSSTHSPRRKFSFRFPNLSHSTSHDKDGSMHPGANGHSTLNHHQGMHYAGKDRRNFSEEAKNVPDLQSTITAENSLAYKSLVEDPKELLFMAPIDMEREEHDMNGATSTLPRIINSPLEHFPQSNKAATLSKLLRKTKDSEPSTSSSSSPLKMLRDASLSMGKQRLKILPSVGSESVTSTTFLLDHDGENPCETPSYMANAAGNFAMPTEVSEPPKLETNAPPPPLPTRDRSNLSLNVTQKRHVRKHPLIIPAGGIQRTLDKFNQVTPVEEKEEVFPVQQIPDEPPAPPPTFNLEDDDDDDVFEDLKNDVKILQEFEKNVNQYGTIKNQEKNYTKSFIENNFPSNQMRHSLIELNGNRTYENLEAFQKRFSCHDEGDTASLHFESILENDDNVANISDDMVDGFCVFESTNGAKSLPSTSEAPVKKPERKSLVKTAPAAVIETKKLEFSQKYPKYKMPRNELASNALFNKIKESVENAAMNEECEVELTVSDECDLKKSINHVSCEDLLDFSDKKPKGRERGAESDEVRIMIKMFGTKVTLERCLTTLDFINWDLQKAIKLCKLQNIRAQLSLQHCLEHLEPHWDLNQITSN